MPHEKLTDFTTRPPVKGDVALILREDGTSEVYLAGMEPIQIQSAKSGPWMDHVIDALALHALRSETGLMDAARQQIISQMSAAFGE